MSLELSANEIDIDIGAMPIRVRTGSPQFARLLESRYGGFVAHNGMLRPTVELDVDLASPDGAINADEDVTVRFESGCWLMRRGDFRATWDAELGRGRVRQSANPYAIDAVLRILHSLILAREGGFLIHAASAIRNGRAHVFAGVSGAGKTTISRLAPRDVTVLTDEISYVRPMRGENGRLGDGAANVDAAITDSDAATRHSLLVAGHLSRHLPLPTCHSYVAFGTPFAGELARIGENTQAPLDALYLLAQGPENRIELVSEAEAAHALMRNILFFANDADLVGRVFGSALEFVRHVPVRRLVFTPDMRVWEMIR